MTSRKRILEYIEYKGITRYRFYKDIGLSNGYLDKDGNMGSDVCAKISYHYGDLNIEWLITGIGEMLKENRRDDLPIAQKVDNLSSASKSIPLIPLDAIAGFGIGETQIMEYECDKYVVPLFRDAEFLISVKGSSMQPKYNSGDLVACRKVPLDTFFQWNKVYVLDTEQGALIKRVRKGTDKNHIILVSDNENYEPFELCFEKIYTIAIVVGVIRLE